MAQQSLFETHRQQLFEKMQDNSIAVLSSAALQYRNHDTEQPFRQCSYFYYATGFDETDALAVLVKKNGQHRFILFCQDKDPVKEQWTGPRVGPQGACDLYGANQAYENNEIAAKLPTLLSEVDKVYFLFNHDPLLHKTVFSAIDLLQKRSRQGSAVPHQLLDFRMIIDECRLFKSVAEIHLMQKACEISSIAHHEAMRACREGMMEYELEAILLYEFYRQGSRHPAYPAIVAAGNNACVLHYTRNQDRLEKDALVLIDAGAEYEGYAADITRTFPASGRFTRAQQAIYELVLAAQTTAIAQVRPGVAWHETQQTILNVLVTGLVDLKILKGEVNSLIEQKAYLPFYMHNSGHWLGLDVHDVGNYKIDNQWRPLEPGMVFTIEPGLYLNANDPKVPEAYRGIGVRIEDDILVTDKGAKELSDVVKSVAAIEKLMRHDKGANRA